MPGLFYRLLRWRFSVDIRSTHTITRARAEHWLDGAPLRGRVLPRRGTYCSCPSQESCCDFRIREHGRATQMVEFLCKRCGANIFVRDWVRSVQWWVVAQARCGRDDAFCRWDRRQRSWACAIEEKLVRGIRCHSDWLVATQRTIDWRESLLAAVAKPNECTCHFMPVWKRPSGSWKALTPSACPKASEQASHRRPGLQTISSDCCVGSGWVALTQTSNTHLKPNAQVTSLSRCLLLVMAHLHDKVRVVRGSDYHQVNLFKWFQFSLFRRSDVRVKATLKIEQRWFEGVADLSVPSWKQSYNFWIEIEFSFG